MPLIIFVLPAIGLYISAGVLLARRLFNRVDSPQPGTTAILTLAAVSLALHSVVLAHSIFTSDGLNLSFFHAGSLVTGSMALLLLCAALISPVENLGIIVFPIAALGLILDLIFPAHHIVIEKHTLGLNLHIIFSILAYSILALAATQAVFLAIQEYHLRHKRPGGFIRLFPPLETMESLLFHMLGLGLFLLTLALIKGFIFLEDIFTPNLIQKTILSIAAWIIFAILLWGRYQFGWRGRVAIHGTIIGFVALLFAYFGSKFIWEFLF